MLIADVSTPGADETSKGPLRQKSQAADALTQSAGDVHKQNPLQLVVLDVLTPGFLRSAALQMDYRRTVICVQAMPAAAMGRAPGQGIV